MDAQQTKGGAEVSDSTADAETPTVSSYRFPARSPQAGAEMALLHSQFRGGAEQ
jgi:hypothetical protein